MVPTSWGVKLVLQMVPQALLMHTSTRPSAVPAVWFVGPMRRTSPVEQFPATVVAGSRGGRSINSRYNTV